MRLVCLFTAAALAFAALADQPRTLPCTAKEESGLPLPSTFAKNNDPAAFQNLLSDFLTKDQYETLGWCSDKSVRDTGPFIAGAYYGTHPVVRVWYSPSFARWVIGGRK